MELREKLEVLIDKSLLTKDEIAILSKFMSATGSIVAAAVELLKYSSPSESSDLIFSKFSAIKHFSLSMSLRDKLNQTIILRSIDG